MTIKIYPEEIVKLCLWDTYVNYIIGSNKESEEILKENKEMELSNKDALVIGLLSVIETNNLIHKFNNYVMDYLSNKTIRDNEQLLVRKKGFDLAVDKFLDKFPDYWEPSRMWVESLSDLYKYIDNIKNELESLELYTIIDKNISFELYSSNNIKKLLKFNY
jgi:hypothetical protein